MITYFLILTLYFRSGSGGGGWGGGESPSLNFISTIVFDEPSLARREN